MKAHDHYDLPEWQWFHKIDMACHAISFNATMMSFAVHDLESDSSSAAVKQEAIGKIRGYMAESCDANIEYVGGIRDRQIRCAAPRDSFPRDSAASCAVI